MYVLTDQRYPLNNISLLSQVRISDGSSKFRPESVNNAPPIVSIKERAFSLESRDRERSLGCKHMRPFSEAKGIYTFFLRFFSAISVKLIVIFIIQGPILLKQDLRQSIYTCLMLAFQS